MELKIHTEKGIILVQNINHDGLNKAIVQDKIQQMLQQYFEVADEITIHHTAKGKPFLDASLKHFISVSHCAGWIALYISDKEDAGVDIEVEKEAIQKVKNTYVNQEETDIFKSFSISYLHLIWGAKEAVYKLLGGKIKNLQQEITVTSIDYRNKILHVSVNEKVVPCYFRVLEEEVYLVYC